MRGKGGKDNIVLKASSVTKTFNLNKNPIKRIGNIIKGKRSDYDEKIAALEGISFELYKGDSLAIIGKNGSGKSTLLQLLCGTLAPTSGEITINGRIAALLELGSGFNPEFTGRENIILNAILLGLTRKDAMNKMDKIIRFADIGKFIDQPLKTYSSGMVVRLAFQ